MLLVRHEILRTQFAQTHQGVVAEVDSESQPDFAVIDASGWDEARLADEIKKEYEVPFDLRHGPLLKTRLFSIAPDHHVILLTLHHIIFDATSLWILQSELQRLYQAEVGQTAELLPALASTYRDFAQWQRAFPDSEDGKHQWQYWQNRLAGEPCPAELPWTYKRPRSGQRNCATINRSIDESVATAFRTVAKRLGTTPFATAMSIFQTLVHRYSGLDDFVIGTTSNGRSQSRFAGGIGYYVNVLPIRTQVESFQTFADLVGQTKRNVLEATQAGDFPFSELVKRLNPMRDASAAPLCRMVFGWQKSHAFSEVAHLLDASGETVAWGSMRAQSYPLKQQEGQFDLTFEVHEGAKSLGCVLKYDRNLIADDAADRLLNHYIELLSAVVADPTLPIDQYQFVGSKEQAGLMECSRGDDLPTVDSTRLDDIWRRSVETHPQARALIFEDHSWTYSSLDQMANEMARRFVAAGIQPGDRIVINTNRCPLVPIALLAALKCGAAYIPTAFDSPDERLLKILEECQPSLLITCEERVDQIRTVSRNGFVVMSSGELDPRNPESPISLTSDLTPTEFSRIDFSPSTTAYIIYTSGSTGTPKGVVVSHAAIALHLASIAKVYEMQASDRVLQFCDLTFDPSLEQFLTPWSVGGSVVMRPDAMYSASGFWRRVKEDQITVANLPPSFMAEAIRSVDDVASLRLMIVGGDVFPSQHLEQWLAKGVRTINAYGPTETVITATTQDVTLQLSVTAGSIPIGRPKPGSVAYVLDRRGNICPIGVAGELCLGGPMLADGYVVAKEGDSARFTSDPFSDENSAKLYRTGDLARWNENHEIEFLGRIDRQIKVRGFRIEPGEIEHAISNLPGVDQALVRLCNDEADPYLVAYVILDDGSHATTESITRQLRSCLPIYMIPERWMVVDAWPLKPSGKVDLDRLPIPPRRVVTTSHIPPQNRLQELMAQAWCEVLELKSVGIDDDFLDVGGGSLQSLRILTRLGELGVVAKDPGVELSPQLMFQYTTIRDLSELMDLAVTDGDCESQSSSSSAIYT
jgi:amino acid adenylation domain-containing protein